MGMTEEQADRLRQVLVTRSNGQWMASVGKVGSTGYTVAHDSNPVTAMFSALRTAGLLEGVAWQHPDPFQRLSNALDAAIIARWAL